MKHLQTAIWTEYSKMKKSSMLYITCVLFAFIPLMMGLMLFVSSNPELGAKLGLIGTKAKMFGENDWKGYLGIMNQMMATLGLIGFGFITAWVFGREHSDRTMKDILALPIKRRSIVFAKFTIIFFWCILVSFIMYCVAILLGNLIDIPGWSFDLIKEFTLTFFASAILTFLLCPLVAYFAGYSHGIIAPIGFVILTMILAQFSGLLGLGPYFPWAIPGLFAVAKDVDGLRLVTSSYIILFSSFLIGYWLTIHWWKTADHQ